MATAEMSRRERQRADTRAELLMAAHELVRNEGYDGLTIRKLAEKVGYAPMSVYSYFADKQAILEAVAQDTFEALARRIADKKPPEPMAALRFGLREYAAFGLENPNEYRTIFMTEKVHEHENIEPEQLLNDNPAFQGLLGCVLAAIEAGYLRGDPVAISTILWTVTHGAISLLLTFQKFPFGEPLDYVDRIAGITLDGMRGKTIEPLSDGWPPCGAGGRDQ